ncbi:DUF6638 family protein [Jannaschia donghaensis]|uniref:Uncharacterized protein n=1 Tax=Jannaschia donghaensis TaxID=420998 RepID=A0A0M6YH93_9RHOB|nr:DUF6638 family protein [Jannaschia donghaensis]CTQ49721.1 hypothetical protein JDO7802_01737 [Jannaschia donghaensis]
MNRLIRHGLMFAGLFEVSSPALVERYNRALEHLSGKRTTLDHFHIDLSGFSPEVGDELDDMGYLNPGGCNRQIILLSTQQRNAPLLEMKFSTSATIIRDFIDANEAQLFRLTARDAVAGELQNSVYSVPHPQSLLDIRSVTVEADTTTGIVRDAAKLDTLITRFNEDPDAWWDDVLVAQMIGLARTTGDVTRAPVTFQTPNFRQDDFWTSHHGGLYVFRSVEHPAVLAALPFDASGIDMIDVTDTNAVATFFVRNGLLQPIVEGRGEAAAGILREKLEHLAIDALGHAGHLPDRTDDRALRRAMQTHADALPVAVNALGAMLAWAEGRGDWPRIDSSNPAYFHTMRAAPGPLRDLVNMVLAELAPQDFRQLHICHKPLFYARYRAMPEALKEWVAERLARDYAADKAGVWKHLYAADVPADMPKVKREGWPIANRGPWG